MDNDLNSLERQIEQDLARWAPRLDASPRPGLLDSVRAAAHLEAHEAWLSDQPAPAPAPGVLERVRAAVVAELGGTGSRHGQRLRHWLTAQGRGSLAAAAMLLLCIGVIWYAGTLTSSLGAREAELVLAALPESAADPILEEIQGLAKNLSDDIGPAVETDDEEESLSDLVQEMDQLLDERDPAQGTSQLGVKSAKVIG
jgi:hypothetical protein